MISSIGMKPLSAPIPPWKRVKKISIRLLVTRIEYNGRTVQFLLGTNRYGWSANLFTIRIQPLGELSPEFSKNARPDRLPDGPHSVKEKGQIVMSKKNIGRIL